MNDRCGKTRYETRAGAEISRVRQAKRRAGTRLRVYRCPDCGGYHFTSQRSPGVNRKRRTCGQ